jgi:hypothetical protein
VTLARLGQRQGLVSDETLNAIEGLAVVRNLSAHNPSDNISTDRARDYLALADAVLYPMRTKPSADRSSTFAQALDRGVFSGGVGFSTMLRSPRRFTLWTERTKGVPVSVAAHSAMHRTRWQAPRRRGNPKVSCRSRSPGQAA